MEDKKLGYETDLMGLPPLRLVLAESTFSAPDRQRQAPQPQKMDREMEGTVKRLIAYLKESEK